MSRRLLLFRHGKSDWEAGARTDFERPLSKRGRQASRRMGRWLREQGLLPDHIVSSPAERARQTILRACRAAGIAEETIRWEPAIYEAQTQALLDVLTTCPQEARLTLVVGHNPGLEELLEHLCGEHTLPPSRGKLLPTAAVALLELPQDWSRLDAGCGRHVRIVRPRELPD